MIIPNLGSDTSIDTIDIIRLIMSGIFLINVRSGLSEFVSLRAWQP